MVDQSHSEQQDCVLIPLLAHTRPSCPEDYQKLGMQVLDLHRSCVLSVILEIGYFVRRLTDTNENVSCQNHMQVN